MKKSSEVKNTISKLEMRIDPESFKGKWLDHTPTTIRQERILHLFFNAKVDGKLHPFTCMTIAPSILNNQVVYERGLQLGNGFSYLFWENALKNYDPDRNSRIMIESEFACQNLCIIRSLVKDYKYSIDAAWYAVCDNSYILKSDISLRKQPSGSNKICNFYDLLSADYIIAKNPWQSSDGFVRVKSASGYGLSDFRDEKEDSKNFIISGAFGLISMD